jgi:cell division protein FtsZ
MERELEISVSAPAPAPAPVQHEAAEAFRPQSKIFASAPVEVQEAPRAAPQPVAVAPAPVAEYRPAPAPVEAPRMEMPRVEAVAPTPVRVEPAPAYQSRIEPQAYAAPREPEMVRMPKVEDFPPVVKAEMDHRTREVPSHGDERGPMGLLKRLTNSLGRKEEEEMQVAHDVAAPAVPQATRRPLSAEASLYAPRRGQLDDQGRTVPKTHSSHDDDQLEIPAFLRRQSN